MTGTLHVPSFGGGIVRVGSPNVQRTDELLAADSLEIGPRGQLIATSDVSDYYTLRDLQGAPAAWAKLYGLGNVNLLNTSYIGALGEGKDAAAVTRYLFAILERSGALTPLPAGQLFAAAAGPAPTAVGALPTLVGFPGQRNGRNVVLVNIGAREGTYPNTAPGLWFYDRVTSTDARSFDPSTYWDCLGTGTWGPGTKSKQLFFRGIVAYNNHIFGWGYDSQDTTNFDGPNRVMFCNQGDPTKWGNDNLSVAVDRDFSDSDAIVLGDAGEIIRGALMWKKRLWFGTNQQLHYVEGFGRNSYLTDGSNPVAKSQNIVGPRAMTEGPDNLMYGVADQGLWAFDGNTFEPHWKRLVDLAGHSIGLWDCIWTDPTAAAGYPGKTNQDLVWTTVDWDREQVVVGIPFCNATLGYGAGPDTIVLKFHTRTGGFTRQVFLGVAYSAASYVRREAQSRETRILGTHTAGVVSLRRFGYQATPTASPMMPTRLPLATFGPYAPFGPDGEGVLRRLYLTLAWESAASLPIVFVLTTSADESPTDVTTLTIGPVAPVAPAQGDIWLDTSQSDTSLGNATAGAALRALGGYLTKTYRAGAWSLVPGSGEVGLRATIPVPLTRRDATRVTVSAQCTAAAGRFELEDLGIEPGGGTEES